MTRGTPLALELFIMGMKGIPVVRNKGIMNTSMAKGLWPYMRTEARIYVRGNVVFISREWSGKGQDWIRRHRFFHNVTPSSLARLERLYAIRQYNYAPGNYEKYRTRYSCPLKQAA